MSRSSEAHLRLLDLSADSEAKATPPPVDPFASASDSPFLQTSEMETTLVSSDQLMQALVSASRRASPGEHLAVDLELPVRDESRSVPPPVPEEALFEDASVVVALDARVQAPQGASPFASLVTESMAELSGVTSAQAPASTAAPEAKPPSLGTLPEGMGRVVAVFGCRGGVGATSLAVNLADTYARVGLRTCVVDLDLQLGDVFVALDLEPKGSFLDVLRDGPNLEPEAFRKRLATHARGFQALTQVGKPEEVDAELLSRLPEVFALLRKAFDVVVVDGVRDFGDAGLAALDHATDILLVTGGDVVSVRCAGRALKLFRQLQYPEERVRLVVNQGEKVGTVKLKELERALELRAAAVLPHAAKDVSRALNAGKLLSEVGSPLAGAIRKFGLAVVPPPATPPKGRSEGKTSGGLFGWFSRSKPKQPKSRS